MHEYLSGVHAQLDYMLFRSKWKNLVKDTRAYSSFSTVGTEHRIVSSHVKLSLRSSKNRNPILWSPLIGRTFLNAALSKRFSIDVYNRFESLSNIDDLNVNNIDEVYSNLITATEDVAKEILPEI